MGGPPVLAAASCRSRCRSGRCCRSASSRAGSCSMVRWSSCASTPQAGAAGTSRRGWIGRRGLPKPAAAPPSRRAMWRRAAAVACFPQRTCASSMQRCAISTSAPGRRGRWQASMRIWLPTRQAVRSSRRQPGLDGREGRLRGQAVAGRQGPGSPLARVAGRPFEATYDGNVGLGREPEADGEVSIKAASWAELVQWLGRQRERHPRRARSPSRPMLRRPPPHRAHRSRGDAGRQLAGGLADGRDRRRQAACQRQAAALRARFRPAAGAFEQGRADRRRSHGCDRRPAARQGRRRRQGAGARLHQTRRVAERTGATTSSISLRSALPTPILPCPPTGSSTRM